MAYFVFQKKTRNQALQLPYFLVTVITMKVSVGEKCRVYNLGDWILYFTYGVFDGKTFEIKKYETK
jgi:hypothetical protein